MPFLAGFVVALLASAVPAGAQVLKADYRLENSLASSAGDVAPLVPLGDNTFATEEVLGKPDGIVRFAEGNGLSLTFAPGALPRDAYTIVVLFRFATTTSWRRVIDFKNAVEDTGLYTKEGHLQFYPHAIGAEPVVQPNAWVQVMLTRDVKKNVSGYVNGKLQFTFVDEGDAAIIDPAKGLRFFRDDGAEHSAGAVARIRIYDGPLTVAGTRQTEELTAEAQRAQSGIAGPPLHGLLGSSQRPLRLCGAYPGACEGRTSGVA